MGAGRSDVEDGANGRLDTVALGDADEGFEVDVDVVLVLDTGVVDEDLHIVDLRQTVVIRDVAGVVGVTLVDDRRTLFVQAGDVVAVLQEEFGDGFANAL